MSTLQYTKRVRGDERGFTLPEVMITIIILGILAGIAIPSWWSIVEGRRVDSATNQMVGDLRLAHSKASSRLTTYRVCMPSNSTTYKIGLQTTTGACNWAPGDPGSPPAPGDPGYPPLERRSLADGTRIGTGETIAFCADGSMEAPPTNPTICPNGTATPLAPGWITITVASNDADPCTYIQVNKTTSRVRVVSPTTPPLAC